MSKIYLIGIDYIGPNPTQMGRRAHMIRVLNKPGHKNVSLEPCIRGWLGTTDNWDKTALGEFTPAEAVNALIEYGIVATESQITHGYEFFV